MTPSELLPFLRYYLETERGKLQLGVTLGYWIDNFPDQFAAGLALFLDAIQDEDSRREVRQQMLSKRL